MRQYLLDSAPLAGYLHGRKPFVELIAPLIQHHQAATSIMVYAEVIEYLKGLLLVLRTQKNPLVPKAGGALGQKRPARGELGLRHWRGT
jgi:hypothetical protein